MARARVHQHVNPLSKYFSELPVAPFDPAEHFERPDLPIHLDIGCGRGRYLLRLAESDPNKNCLGIEIREPLVKDANTIRDSRKLGNLHYEFCNATIDLDVLLKDLPEELLQTVTINFPDPWFKKRHAKRRMVKDRLVETIAEHLAGEGIVLIQTDVEFLAEEMSELFRTGGFCETEDHPGLPNLKTERERSVLRRGLPVFRAVFRKKK